MDANEVREFVYNYKTKYKRGFTDEEVKEVLKKYPEADNEKFHDAMIGNTGILSDEGEFVNYHVDVLHALYCGLENRDLYPWEFD